MTDSSASTVRNTDAMKKRSCFVCSLRCLDFLLSQFVSPDGEDVYTIGGGGGVGGGGYLLLPKFRK